MPVGWCMPVLPVATGLVCDKVRARPRVPNSACCDPIAAMVLLHTTTSVAGVTGALTEAALGLRNRHRVQP